MPVFKNRMCLSLTQAMHKCKALREILLMNNAASLGRVFPFSSTDVCSSSGHLPLFSTHMQKVPVLNLAKQTFL